MTKREINEAIRAANGALAWCREFVKDTNMEGAANQARAAQIACASVTVRCEQYAEEHRNRVRI